jgi:hypothetical protein
VFEGFKFEYVDVGDATLRVRHGSVVRTHLRGSFVSVVRTSEG